MKAATRYRYEQQVRRLREENDRLYCYRDAMKTIFEGVCQCVENKNYINHGWILRQMKGLFK